LVRLFLRNSYILLEKKIIILPISDKISISKESFLRFQQDKSSLKVNIPHEYPVMAKFARNKRSGDPARKKKKKPGDQGEEEAEEEEDFQGATSHKQENLHFCHI